MAIPTYSKQAIILAYLLFASFGITFAQEPIGYGWAKNSVNAVIFRKNSIASDGKTQYLAYYDSLGFLTLAKRKLHSSNWETKTSTYKGHVKDAHNSISIMIDGDGFLHVAFDHHNNPLRYCTTTSPGGLILGELKPMLGNLENKVTYPEFHKMQNGNLLFMYRDGQSGRGNLIINQYNSKTKKWLRLHNKLIDGENKRNAYWQTFVGSDGTIHVSWVWRETWDVSTNHDLCYAKSTDGGATWQKSNGEKYELPIKASTAEYACKIPQKSELINQTSMYADNNGVPYITSYWTPKGTKVPQFHIIYLNGGKWTVSQVSDRKQAFSLSGGGTKKIPISRPQILVKAKKGKTFAALIFRDIERNNKVSLAFCKNLNKNQWKVKDLTNFSVGSWEPSFDTELWKSSEILDIFVQEVGQGDGENIENIPATPIYVLRWK